MERREREREAAVEGGGDTVKLPLDRIFMAPPTETDRADEHAACSLSPRTARQTTIPVLDMFAICWKASCSNLSNCMENAKK